MRYRSDIDGLRAIAVLLVVSFHAFPAAIKGGFVGVDIFFVISGFLITSILLNAQHLDLKDFYRRRILRIFPALSVVLGVCLVGGWALLLSGEFKQLGKHVVAGSAFFANLAFWSEAGYFDAAADTKPLLHLWSLGVEEQFYIAWPLLLFGARKLRLKPAVLIAVLFCASFAINLHLASVNVTADFYSPLSRAWQLLSGAAIAVWFQCRRTSATSAMSALVSETAAAAGLLAILLSVLLFDAHTVFPGLAALLPTLGAAAIIASAPGTRAADLLSSQPLVWMGKISYPLYLWHWPLLSFAHILYGTSPPPATAAVLMACATILAALTVQFIEKPVRHSTGKLAPRSLMAAMAVICASGGAVYLADGVPSRHPEFEKISKAAGDWAHPGTMQRITEKEK